MSNEILCRACGKIALLRREPIYDGFKKTGETVICTACGHEYPPGSEIPYRDKSKRPAVFTEADRPDKIRIFRDDERGNTCRLCHHFVVNPFTQRCGLHNRVVQATDWCADFDAKTDD